VIELANDEANSAPSVAHQFGCLVFRGKIPLKLIAESSKALPTGAFLDADAARAIGASAVVGNEADIAVLRENAQAFLVH
jgi:hypothetical protein